MLIQKPSAPQFRLPSSDLQRLISRKQLQVGETNIVYCRDIYRLEMVKEAQTMHIDQSSINQYIILL